MRPWENSNGEIAVYSLLVPHRNCQTWQWRAPKGVAFRRDLYTTVGDVGEVGESDDFERWLTEEYEAPARQARDRLLAGQDLLPWHLQHLGRYALCQEIRTPQGFLEFMAACDRTLPTLMKVALDDAVRALEEFTSQGIPFPRQTLAGEILGGAFRFEVKHATPDCETAQVGAAVLVGRDFWLRHQRHTMQTLGDVAALQSWSIAEACPGCSWPTSDQPVARVSFENDSFTLGGGWKQPKVNILLPLSPRYLLVAQVGDELPSRVVFNPPQTLLIRNALTLRAHRMVFAHQFDHAVVAQRPRMVDPQLHAQEAASWAAWHDEQVAAQTEFEGNAGPA